MHIRSRISRFAALSLTIVAVGGCANAGGLGEILGSVLGGAGGTGGQVLAGTVRAVDTRNQQISVQQSNGQSVAVLYDQNTKVVYQNKLYAVTNLESGDQINARLQSTQSNAYYTDSITVTQPSPTGGGTGTSTENLQQLQGNVQTIDRANGRFTINAGSGVALTVAMPYRATSTDQTKYNNLRIGDFVRFTGVYLNNSLVELRQFY